MEKLRVGPVTPKSSLSSDSKSFSWSAGDAISVYTSDGSASELVKFSTSAGGEETDFSGMVLDGYTVGKVALYPYSESHSVSGDQVTFMLPQEYDYDASVTQLSTNMPLAAVFGDASGNVEFKHIGGVLRINLMNVPAGADKFVFTSTNTVITGRFALDISQDEPVISSENVSSGGKTVTVNFGPLAENQDQMSFFIPVPVCTVRGWSFVISAGDKAMPAVSTSKATVVSRRSVLTATFKCTEFTADT